MKKIIVCYALALYGCDAARPASETDAGVDTGVDSYCGCEAAVGFDALVPPTIPCPTEWSCEERDGRTFCQNPGNAALPWFGHDWSCHLAPESSGLTWVCTGLSPVGGEPSADHPCRDEWSCRGVRTVGELPPGASLPHPGYDNVSRCTRPDGAQDRPPGFPYVACVKGSRYGGTRCEVLDRAPNPPSSTIPPPACHPGTRVWCDGLQYDSWGQATCTPEGKWPTKMVNGKQVLDCQEMSTGARPDTACACYHFFVNVHCCERADCIVPYDGAGRICEESPGETCDWCNIQKPECAQAGAKCVVTNTMETFCAAPCDDAPCEPGYQCVPVKNQGKKCVPYDFSCYY